MEAEQRKRPQEHRKLLLKTLVDNWLVFLTFM